MNQKLYEKLLSIGFKNTVLKKHKELIEDPILEENYNELDAIKYLWRQWCSFSSLQEQEEENTINTLKMVGFTTKVATKMSKILDPLWGHYNSDTIVDIAIEYLNGAYDEFAPHIKRGFFRSKNAPPITKTIKSKVKHIDIEYDDPQMEEKIVEAYGERSTLYFHATSWRAVNSICEEGVVHDTGRYCTDFGIKPSFYVGPSLHDASEWASKKYKVFKRETAILVFSFSYPSQVQDFKNKNFEKPNREWTRLVGESRACQKKYNELDSYDVVYGPMVSNISTISPHKPIKWQLASKSPRFDDFLDRQLVGVIWFAKE